MFGSGGSVQTVGAGKSGVGDDTRYGPDARWFLPLLGLGLLLLAPFAFGAAAVVGVTALVRRVRVSRLVVTAAVLSAGSLLLGLLRDGNGLAPLRWYLEGMGGLIASTGLLDQAVTAANFLVEVEAPEVSSLSATQALLLTAPLSVPLGAWLATGYAAWMQFRRSALADLEGDLHHGRRPVGLLDYRRGRRNIRKIATGAAIDDKRGTVGIGIGEYGALISLATRTLLRATLIFGGPREGKTMWTLSTIGQIVRLGRSGWIVLDFKGDGVVPVYVAQVARGLGRPFKHFALADKNGAQYRAPIEGAPDSSAYYEPLMRGNATSKTDMLVNSVPREGDAMAYFRAQYEYVQTVFQVTALTHYDQSKGGFNTLLSMLDPEVLQKQSFAVDPDTGKGYLAEQPGLQERVNHFVETLKGDPIQAGAIHDAARTLSTQLNGPAVGPRLRPAPAGQEHLNIDLAQAVRDGEFVVFSLSTQDYGDLARMMGTLVLLDLQNAIAELRTELTNHRQELGDDDAPPPWDPGYVQIEEYGACGSDAVLGLLNKAGDVNMRAFLSTQSWYDVYRVDDTGTFARQVLDLAGNVISFKINDGDAATVLSNTSPQVTKKYPQDSKEWSGGLFGLGLKAANIGKIRPDVKPDARAAEPGAFQELDPYSFLWIAKSPVAKAAHSFTSGPNHWVETIKAVQVDPVGDPDRAPGPNTEEPAQAPTEATVTGPSTSAPRTADPFRTPSVAADTTAWDAPPTHQGAGFTFSESSYIDSVPGDLDEDPGTMPEQVRWDSSEAEHTTGRRVTRPRSTLTVNDNSIGTSPAPEPDLHSPDSAPWDL